ncbi:hypothetical protein FACS189496_2760 [Bacilli bacterium]|nr:hypothetical protein FACS189496_2760 [Bacilli bacterium]
MYIKRTIENVVINESKNIPVVMVYGPRQVGKSCMLNYLKKQHKIIVNEMISLRNDKYKKLAINDPEQFLIDHPFPVVIDEIQLAPNLFSYISNIVDEQRLTNKKESNGMYFLTGSESIELIKNASETLAGRVSLLAMNSLSYKEINNQIQLPFLPDYNQLFKTPTKILTTESIYKNIFIGGYPEIISNPNIDIEIFFESYIKTYIQRDVTKIINIIDETKFRKFIETVAARTGQEYIVDELAKDNNIDNKTVEK